MCNLLRIGDLPEGILTTYTPVIDITREFFPSKSGHKKFPDQATHLIYPNTASLTLMNGEEKDLHYGGSGEKK